MDFKKTDMTYDRRGRQRTRELLDLLDRFASSGIKIVEITDWESNYINAGSCASSLTNTLKRYNLTHIRIFVRDGKPYLLNKLVED